MARANIAERSTMRHACLCLILCCFLVSNSWAAPVQGDRVRVHHDDSTTVGQFSGIEGDAVVLQTDNGTETVLRDSITRVEVSEGRKGHALPGMLIGAGVGLGAALIALAADDDNESTFFGEPVNEDVFDIAGVILFTAAGAAAGLVIGHLVKTDRWTESSFGSPSMGLMLDADGRMLLAAGWTVRF